MSLQQPATQAKPSQRVSPELLEVLQMLKTLEGQPVTAVAPGTGR